MFLRLNHQNLDIYNASINFVVECYKFSKHLPVEEKFGMISQVRRAALSVHLNIGEGFSKKSPAERKRYFEISRESIIEIDAAFDVAEKLNYFSNYNKDNLKTTMLRTYEILSGLIKALSKSSLTN
ncbi:MAG: four helix bundle protein [Ferruginibacter sp.]